MSKTQSIDDWLATMKTIGLKLKKTKVIIKITFSFWLEHTVMVSVSF